jgi:hypothetical protein
MRGDHLRRWIGLLICALVGVSAGCGTRSSFSSEALGPLGDGVAGPSPNPPSADPGGGSDTGVDGIRIQGTEYTVCTSRDEAGHCVDPHIRFRAVCVRSGSASAVGWPSVSQALLNGSVSELWALVFAAPWLRRASTYSPFDIIFRPWSEDSKVAIVRRHSDGRPATRETDPSGQALALVSSLWVSSAQSLSQPDLAEWVTGATIGGQSMSVDSHRPLRSEDIATLVGLGFAGCEPEPDPSGAFLPAISNHLVDGEVSFGVSTRFDLNAPDGRRLTGRPGLYLVNRCGEMKVAGGSPLRPGCEVR